MIFIKITIIYCLLLFVNKWIYQTFTKQKVFFSQILSPNMKHKELGTKEFSFFRMAFIYATSLKYFFEHTTKLTRRCSHLPLYTNITTDLCCLSVHFKCSLKQKYRWISNYLHFRDTYHKINCNVTSLNRNC